MPITRVTWTDDSGAGIDGTIVNNAQLQSIYDSIENAFTPTNSTHAAGNFTANGAMTWTVGSTDQTTFRWSKIDKRMRVHFDIETSSVGGTPNTTLQITIPSSNSAAVQTSTPFYYIDAGTHGVGLAQITAAGTVIRLVKPSFANWTTGTDNTYVYGQIEFETST